MTPLTSRVGLGLATGHHIAGTALRFVFFSFVFLATGTGIIANVHINYEICI